MNDRMGAKDYIRKVMDVPAMKGRKLALHEIKQRILEQHHVLYSENSLATRLSEMAQTGEMRGTLREGTAYKEWEYLGWHTSLPPAEVKAAEPRTFFFFSTGQENSPCYTHRSKCLEAAAKRLNEACRSVTLFAGTPERPQMICTLSI